MDWLAFGIGYGVGFMTAGYTFYLFQKARQKTHIVQKAIKRALEEQN